MPVKITDEKRKVADLTADPKNAKRHSEQQISKIAASIERFGYVNKIAIRPTGMIIGGHATLEGVKRLGWVEVEVRVVAGLTDPQYQALGLALNKLPEGSSWDEGILADLVGTLHELGEDVASLGFSDKETTRLLDPPDDIEVKAIETGDVEDEFWISVRGPLPAQAEALKRLEDALKPLSGVTVELGTIAVGA